MAGLLGTGVLVNWGGVVAEHEEDYNAWHSLEHMPERLAVPGFRRGRRAVAVDEVPAHLKYFMMYEADDTDVFVSPPYLARLNDPTPWTQRILSAYVVPSRTVCRVLESRGRGVGGWLATIHFDTGKTAPPASRLAGLVDAVSQRPGILGAHLLEGDPRHGQQPTKEKRFRESRGDPDRTVSLALLIDGFDERATRLAGEAALGALPPGEREAATHVLFQVQHVISDRDARPAGCP